MPIATIVNKEKSWPTVRFTPDYYRYAYTQYRKGNLGPLVEMLNQAETDGQVSGCLRLRRAGFQVDHIVDPFSDETKDVERAEWLTDIFKNLKMRKLHRHIQEGRMKGYKVIDFDWDVVKGKQVPISFEAFEQKYFRRDPDTQILKIDWGKNLEDIPETALTCETDETPEELPVLRDYILKVFGIESWASFIERFGEPTLIGWYPAGAEQEFKDELEAALGNIARAAYGIAPDLKTGSGEKMIDKIETNRTTGDHNLFEDRCNKSISITILGHANAVEQSKGLQVGENQTQYKVVRSIAVDDMYFIEENVNQLIKTIIDRNFGDGRYPAYELDKKEKVDIKEMSSVVDMAHRHGVTIMPENYAILGLKLAEDQEPVTKQPSPLDY